MTHLGRFQLGDRLPVVVRTLEAGVPTWPAAPPTVTVYALGGDAATAHQPADHLVLGAEDQGRTTGLFRRAVFLGPAYSPWLGRYAACVRWVDSGGTTHARAFTFDVVAGGSASGDITAMALVERPGADWLLVQRYDETLATALNPR